MIMLLILSSGINYHKEINQAVKNNPEKFPKGYILELSDNKKFELVKNFDRFNRQKHSTAIPKAFTEKGL